MANDQSDTTTGLSKEWCLKMAELEGDQEIGAGLLARDPIYPITAKRLESGYWLISGHGPCEWAQPPSWPCDETTLREHAFPQASEQFIREAMQNVRT